MGTYGEPALIITDGGLAGLLACFIEGVCRPAVGRASAARAGEQGGQRANAAWLSLEPGQESEREGRTTCARRAVEVCHLADLLTAPSELPAGQAGDNPLAVITPMLMAAGAAATRRGLSRVVWAIHLGGPGERGAPYNPDLDAISAACDRAMVCSRLLSLDAGPDGLTIQTPFVDFSDAQIADLAADVDLPLDAAWLGDDAERSRWAGPLERAGLALPASVSVVRNAGRLKTA